MTVAGVGTCPTCGEAVGPGDRFCEGCGAPLAPLAPVADATAPAPVGTAATAAAAPVGGPSVPVGTCPACGSTDGVDADGFCLSCGVRSVRPRDRMETDLGALVAVSDKGPHKARNEDSFAVALLDGGDGFVLSVCDGVSNVARSDEASQAAADAAVTTLAAATTDGVTATDLMVRAASAASVAVTGLAPMAVGADPPSCTFLALRWRAEEGLTVGWLGDCRVYLVLGDEVRRLTVDHSWGTEEVRAGRLTQAQADADDRSHAITRWLGADAGEPVPDVVGLPLDPRSQALVVAVSDGAWNYFESPEQVATFFAGVSLLEGARRCTEHAIAGGGHDNITVVAGRVHGPDPDRTSTREPT